MSILKQIWKYHQCSTPAPSVLLLEFNRAPINAFHDDMWKELREIVDRVSSEPEIRVVVLSSRLDKGFTAGLDVKSQVEDFKQYSQDPAHAALQLHDHVLDFQDAISCLARCRVPVIAAMYGICFGLAIDIASACDIRFAASNAAFSIAEVNVGLAADIGTLQRFPKIIGNDSKARELAMTAERFEAAKAKEIGFLSEVVSGGRTEVIDAAVDIAKVMAEKAPIAVMSTKHLMNQPRSIQEGLEYTAAWNMAMLQSGDVIAAMRSVMSKKPPRFASLPPTKARAKL